MLQFCKVVYRVLVGKPEGKVHSEGRGVDGRMGSEWILVGSVGGCGAGADLVGSG
jgi:hypothetical protein